MRRLLHSAVLALVTVLAVSGCGRSSGTTTDPSFDVSPSTNVTSTRSVGPPPWPAPSNVTQRVSAAGLDLGPMGMAAHYHPQLLVNVNGKAVQVPGGIGVDPASGAMSAMHTHETDGTLHIEADRTGEVFTLGQFFTEWGVRLSRAYLGSVRASGGVQVTSNGRRVAGDPGKLRLRPDQQIVVTVP